MDRPLAPSLRSRATLALILAALFPVLAGRADAQTVSTFATGLNAIRGLQFDAAGNLYATLRTPSSKIVKFTPPSNTPTTFATGVGDAIEMVFDDAGNMYVTEYVGDNVGGSVVKITPGGVKSTLVAIPSAAPITRDAAGNLYVGEYFNQRIDKVTLAGVKTTYVASVGTAGARLTMVHMDTDGTMYAGMLDGNIYKIGPGGSPITAFNHSMASCAGFCGGAAGGDWYACSYDNDEVFRITAAGVGQLFAGAHGVAGFVDGVGSAARFNWPSFVVRDGNLLYVAEYANDAIRTILIDQALPARRDTWGRVKAAYR